MEFLVQHKIADLHHESLKLTGSDLKGETDANVEAITVDKNEIFLKTSTPLDYFLSVVHEFGHIFGQKLSFKNNEVLNPDEVKKTSVNLSISEYVKVMWLIFRNKPQENLGKDLMPIITRILNIYTKNNFDFSSIPVHEDVPQAELDRMLKKDEEENLGLRKNKVGEIESFYSKQGRDAELSAASTEIAFMHILENSLKKFPIPLDFIFSDGSSPPHAVARRITMFAYKRHGWVLPSEKDLSSK